MKDENKSKAELVRELKVLQRRIEQLEAAVGGQASPLELVGDLCRPLDLNEALDSLKVHDHLCVIYESMQEWRDAVVPFVAMGLERGEKCIVIVDLNLAYQLRKCLIEAGVDVASVEASGQLSTLCGVDKMSRAGFGPDEMIELLTAETGKAIAEGYPLLRATGEMSWALGCYPGSGKLLECESRLNRDFFSSHPCIYLCQYDRWKLTPEIVRDVVKSHPHLVRRNRLQRNFYYIPPEEVLGRDGGDCEVHQWLSNIEREWQIEEAIRRLAYYDSLTGLPNRLLFNDYLTRALNRARSSGRKLAMMLLDLDELKRVNDTLGHSIGDRLLKSVGVRLKSLLREGDIVGRMGGDEFMLLLPEISRDEDAVKIAQRILEAFRRPIGLDTHELYVTASIGVAIYPADGEDADTLTKNADIAMYFAKEKGRDNYQRYSAAARDKAAS